MKTLNLTLRTILLTLTIVGSATTSLAYNFMVNGVYYNKNGDKATVTYIDCYDYSDNGGLLSGVNRYNYKSKYKNQVTIPETVTYDGVSYSVTSIGNYAFANCWSLTDVTIPNTVTSIGSYAFYGCRGLTNITIPISVTNIDSYAFNGCSGLSYINIPDYVTSIGDYAFNNCSKITNVTIGESVVSIGYNAFNCSSLLSITCLATMPPSASGFPNTNTAKLYVPMESVELYRTTTGWNYFTNVFGFGNDSFSIPDETSFHGDTIVIPVSMQNENEITAFQTDIYLPEGFELVNKNNEYQVTLSDRKGRDHVIMVNNAPDGALRVLSYSPTLKPFKNNEGELFYITVKVPEGANGKFPIWLRNTILTSTDEEELYAIDALSNVSVTNIIMGDVDGNGAINVADIVQTARYILNYNPEPFIFDAADINGDSKITITDVVKIAHLVLDADYDEPTKKMNAPSDGDNIVCGDFDYNSHMVAICLNNDQGYTAFQLDLTFPMGMTASEFALTERANSLGLIVKNRGNGKVRVLGYSPDLKTITGNNGTLLSFHVDRESEILVDNIQLVTPEGFSVCPNGFVIAMDNTTKVNEQAVAKVVDHINYYNLAGQRIDCPESGVTLTVTTYADGTRTTSKVIK